MKKLLIISFILLAQTLQAQQIHLSKGDGGFWFSENGKKILFFQRELNDSIPAFARNNYFHPVFDLNGNCITEDFPADHLHHRGIFWAWHQVIIDSVQICDPWEIKNFTQKIDQIEFVSAENGNGILTYSSFWHTRDNPNDAFMRENTNVTIYPRQLNYRRIDFTIKLRALEYNLQMGGSSDEKGYSGFSVRLITNESTQFTDRKNNRIIPENKGIDAGELIDISNKKMKSGITIISWPQNPENEKWILRQTRSMQNCAWPGPVPVEISVLKPLELKYTLIIHKGNRKNVPLNNLLENIQTQSN